MHWFHLALIEGMKVYKPVYSVLKKSQSHSLENSYYFTSAKNIPSFAIKPIFFLDTTPTRGF